MWSHHNKLLTSLLKYHVYTMDARIVLADLFLMCGGRGVFPWSVAGFIHPKTRNPSLLFTSSVSLHDGRTHWHSTAAAHRGAQSNTQGLLLSIHNHSLPTKHSRGISYLIFWTHPLSTSRKVPSGPSSRLLRHWSVSGVARLISSSRIHHPSCIACTRAP